MGSTGETLQRPGHSVTRQIDVTSHNSGMGLFQILVTVVLLGVGGVMGQAIVPKTTSGCEGAVTLHLADSTTVVYTSTQFNDGPVTGVNHKYEEVTMTGSCCFLLYQSPKGKGKTHRLNSPVHKEKSHLRRVGAINTTACLRRGSAPLIVSIVCGLVAVALAISVVVVIKKKCCKKQHKPFPRKKDI